jgi:hypothetical protein
MIRIVREWAGRNEQCEWCRMFRPGTDHPNRWWNDVSMPECIEYRNGITYLR